MFAGWSLASRGLRSASRLWAALVAGAALLPVVSCGSSSLPAESPSALEARTGQDGGGGRPSGASGDRAGATGDRALEGALPGATGAAIPLARPLGRTSHRGGLPREAVEAQRAVDDGDGAEAAFLLSEALGREDLDDRTRQGLRRRLEPLRSDLLRGRVPTDLFATYTVVPGDSLSRICKKLKKTTGVLCEVGMLRMLNGLPGDKIFPDQKLRHPTQSARIEVRKSTFRIRVWLGRLLLREYECGIGKENRTPEGEFVIAERLVDPPWFRKLEGDVIPFGDPRNVLGSRWLGFAAPFGEYGIHGTTDPDSIGRAESNGCIRLRNDAVEDLFDLIPRGTRVSILP